MSVNLESAARLSALKSGIEAKTGETYTDLTGGVNALIAGFGAGGSVGADVGILDGTLTEYNNPNLITGIKHYGLYQHESIQKFIARNCTGRCGNNALRQCPKLSLVDASFSILSSACFANDPMLTTIVLRRADAICHAESNNILVGTPFASGGTGGTIYVPSALVETYKTATNWVAIYNGGACNFVAIEGSEYE